MRSSSFLGDSSEISQKSLPRFPSKIPFQMLQSLTETLKRECRPQASFILSFALSIPREYLSYPVPSYPSLALSSLYIPRPLPYGTYRRPHSLSLRQSLQIPSLQFHPPLPSSLHHGITPSAVAPIPNPFLDLIAKRLSLFHS